MEEENEKQTYLIDWYPDRPVDRKPRLEGATWSVLNEAGPQEGSIGAQRPREEVEVPSEGRRMGRTEGCGPIGSTGIGSHGSYPSKNPPAAPWKEGESISQVECRGKVHIEPAERFGARRSVWMIERTRHQRRRSKFARVLRFSRRKW
jgi:hypothetical protein